MVDETNTPGEGAAPGPDQQEGGVPELAAQVELLKGQLADLTDRLLRAHAEMDNMRKRAEREREETAKYAITRFARDVVTVADNFERAAGAVPAEAAEQDPALKNFLDGVTMTEREFMNVLERHGVKRIIPKGEMFNPHQHQAMMEMHSAEVPPGTILQVYQPGYLIEDRVLRPAMVVVAKGGQKPNQAQEASSAGERTGPADPDDQGS
jgi:molecular chaperone GrpE